MSAGFIVAALAGLAFFLAVAVFLIRAGIAITRVENFLDAISEDIRNDQ